MRLNKHISNDNNKKHFINFDFEQDNKNTLSFKEVKIMYLIEIFQ